MNNCINNPESVKSAITNAGFIISHETVKSKRESKFAGYDDLNLSRDSIAFWQEKGYTEMWSHQKKAIAEALGGKNVCISTSTSSGKTEIFQTIAIEKLNSRKEAKVLAVYSAKALNRQQLDRWGKTGKIVGKIDGDVKDRNERIDTLKNCDIIAMTPDVIHAFLLANVDNKKDGDVFKNFIKNVDLIIIDEIHLYRGVFGSNSAYLFRRFNDLRRFYRKDLSFPQYVTASATLPNPAEHSAEITGARDFVNIGIEEDGSPSSETIFLYVSKDKESKTSLPESIAKLISRLTLIEDAKSITFTNGRQKAGDITMDGLDNLTALGVDESEIYAFRAGGEEDARRKILNAMESRDFKGVVSTSALEIGIDVSGLNVCILANLPYDLNSYYQRIGRVGRGGSDNKSYVIVVNDDSIPARILFDGLYDINRVLPDLEPALHLENKNIQYLNAVLHIANRTFGKRAEASSILDGLAAYFPKSFCQLAHLINTDQAPTEYNKFVERMPEPHLISLRNMGRNYRIVEGDEDKEDVTVKQLCNEAYRGAVRNAFRLRDGEIQYYLQRVNRIERASRRIIVSEQINRNIRTKPNHRTYINPLLTSDYIGQHLEFGDTKVLNTSLWEVQRIYGYYNIIFQNQEYKQYDRPDEYKQFTTGFLILNNCLGNDHVDLYQIADIVYEAFMMRKRFERSDIDKGVGTIRNIAFLKNIGVNACDKCIAIYDTNILNITKDFANEKILRDVFKFLKNNISHFEETLFENPINEETRDAILTICDNICDMPLTQHEITDIPNTITVLAINSPAILKQVNNVGEIEEISCRICGIMKANQENTVDYNVIRLDKLDCITVEMDNVILTSDSVSVEYDWKNGIIVNN